MSYASEAKRELSLLPLEDACCMRAELAGLIGAGGTLILKGRGEISLCVETEHPSVARRSHALLKRLSGEAPGLRTLMHRRLGRHVSYRAAIGKDATERVLALCRIPPLGVGKSIGRGLADKECCRRSFLRGAFLAAGALADPQKGYHIEWRTARPEFAGDIRKIAGKYAPNVRISRRKELSVVYCKDSEQIADLLSAMGAVEALLRLQNVKIYKEMRNQVNRIVNCESANVDKTTRAAQRQIESIRYLEARGVLRNLPPELIEAAAERLKYPEATLEELGDLFSPPIGKSGVNHRMRRLTALARSMQDKEETTC